MASLSVQLKGRQLVAVLCKEFDEQRQVCLRVYSKFVKQNLKRHFHDYHPNHGKSQGTTILRRKEPEDSPDASSVQTLANVKGFVQKAAQSVREKISEEVKHKIIHLKLDVASRHFRSQLGVNIQYYCTLRKALIVRSLGFIELLSRHTSSYLRSEVYKILDVY